MNSFIEKLSAHGVDTETALSRFADDGDLYEKCFYMLLDDPNFKGLGSHLAASDYEAAFNAAHSLKGVVGNLELTILYKSVSALVESLRARDFERLDTQYQDILAEYELLKTLGS